MLIVDVVSSFVTALICGIIVANAAKERKTSAMRWIRAGVLVLGLNAFGDFTWLAVSGSRLPFAASMIGAILWSLLSTAGVVQILRHRRRPSLAERVTTTLAALSSSFGFIWLFGLGTIVQSEDVGLLNRSLVTIVLLSVVVQITSIIVSVKRTEQVALPGFSSFAAGSLTISFTYVMTAFDHLGITASVRIPVELFGLVGVVGLGASLWGINTKRAARSHRHTMAPLFFLPAIITVALSIVKYAETTDEYVFGFTSMILFTMLMVQTASHRSDARRTQAALERRVAQRTHELEQANQLVNRAVEFTADGIVALDPAQAILFMNPASRRILGETQQILDMIRAQLQLGDTSFDLLDETASPPRTIRVIATCLDFSNVSWVLTLRDVTEEVGVLRMKTRILTAVSHEIRTPLTSLHASLALLDSGTIAGLPHEAAQLSSIARSSSDRLLRLVNEYLDFERLNSRAPETLLVQLDDLAEVVREVERLMKPLAADRKIRLALEVDSVDVPMSRDKIVQVLSNLVHNAIKFSPPDCVINVETQCSEGAVTVSVLDRGRGLHQGELDDIFEPFFQSSFADHPGGTGMGLSICRSIIEKHGGRIWAEPRDGGGAAFRFSLPIEGAELVDRIAS